MEQMSFLAWIVIGGLAGWIASKFMGTDKDQGVLANIIVGVVGAFIPPSENPGLSSPGMNDTTSTERALALA